MSPRSIPSRIYPVNMVAHLRSLAAERPGDTATVTIRRDGQQQDLQVQLAQRPDQQGCR